MLHVQEFLRHSAAQTLDLLETVYHIHAKRHAEFPNLVLLKYDQIDSPMGDPLVQQCRGLILDEADDWRVICRPFDKFFNYGEGHAAPIDWDSARVYEKLDGSLMSLYYYRGRWQVSSSGTPDASGDINGSALTFAQLFWQTWAAQGMMLPPLQAQGYTFMFELTSPYNHIVVSYASPLLRLIGVRHNLTGAEVGIRLVDYTGWRKVQTFDLSSLDACLSAFEDIEATHQEGFVVCDALFNRIKIKHPIYVALHHLRDSLSMRRVAEIVRSNESAEVLAYFPEWQHTFDRVKGVYDYLVDTIGKVYASTYHHTAQKDFALAVKDFHFSGVLFALRKGTYATVPEALKAVHIDRLLDWMGLNAA